MTSDVQNSSEALVAERISEHIARVGLGVSFDDLPDEIVRRAEACLLDWLGCALIGSRTEVATTVHGALRAEFGVGCAGLIGGEFDRLPPSGAALFNGTAGHALDFDDGCMGVGHTSATIVPAALAIGQVAGADGRSLVEAVVAGQEVAGRVAALVGRDHTDRGWHTTGTVGTFGAAAASAKLLGLDHQGWTAMLGIASTQAAGLRVVFGTMSKPINAGRAASTGLMAAQLAAHGVDSGPDGIGGTNGFAWTQTGTPDRQAASSPLGPPYLAERIHYKKHASCTATHGAIDAAKALVTREGIRPEEIARVIVRQHEVRLEKCSIPHPRTSLEAKFSIGFCTVLGLLGRDTTEAGFGEPVIFSADVQAMLDRVTLEPLHGASQEVPTQVEVLTADGCALRAEVDNLVEDRQPRWDALREKFERLAAPVVGEQAAQRVVELVRVLPALADVNELHEELKAGAARVGISVT